MIEIGGLLKNDILLSSKMVLPTEFIKTTFLDLISLLVILYVLFLNQL